MYYEEKLINGVLMYRKSPRGDWYQCSIESVCRRLVDAESLIKELDAKVFCTDTSSERPACESED